MKHLTFLLLVLCSTMSYASTSLFLLDVDKDPDNVLAPPVGNGTYWDTVTVSTNQIVDTELWLWTEGNHQTDYIYSYSVTLRIASPISIQSVRWEFPDSSWEAWTAVDPRLRIWQIDASGSTPIVWCESVKLFTAPMIITPTACADIIIVGGSLRTSHRDITPTDNVVNATICTVDNLESTGTEYTTWSSIKTLFK